MTGPVSSAGLGLTLTHEHLSNDLRAAVTEPDDPSLAFLRHARTEPGLAWLLREQPYACLDHCRLDDAPAVLADLRAFAEAGGGTVVDVTPDGIGRDPLALRSLAERSGLRIVMGSGWYLERHHPAGLSRADERTLAAGLVAEFADGARGTGVRPGVIGEIGVSADFTPGEHTALRAAARAQRETGVPLYVHLPGWRRRAHEVLDIVLGDYGVPPGAVVLCHMDPSHDDPAYQNAVAERGVWLEFDMIGMPFSFPGEGRSPAPDEVARAIAGLIQRGHAGRLLLSHDVFLKSMLTAYGGNGFRYVPELFVRRLTALGVAADVAQGLLRSNPARLFEAAAS
ncbi:phosphotriesterase family protein [Actinomadura madurae]|uniref:phosphotriesterase family protein n=1 Tax=Actinomadura madurae TaxID=1993 RepID=UPI0020D2510D|nr:phosphotriesterase-related protein [Actinomadura madurae]MCP9948382.1 phosphotriesterase-related protein [Actinomadura madurae]MCP9965156.1 phosphotriesterase-related protein [Actinomadura madurae]MCP9977649.1 phosphotriesterase-related protein [Actinomadura madurae]MCQ0013833.1 phosphotriesterase-related protein [Actinomadura madurae]